MTIPARVAACRVGVPAIVMNQAEQHALSVHDYDTSTHILRPRMPLRNREISVGS